MTRRRYELSDEQWQRIEHLLPGKEGDPGRTAKDNRPDPNADARNTRSRAAGTDARTTASTPRAHPTTTRPRTSGNTARTAATHAADGEREPENPTTGADERAEQTDMATTWQVKKKPEPGG